MPCERHTHHIRHCGGPDWPEVSLQNALLALHVIIPGLHGFVSKHFLRCAL